MNKLEVLPNTDTLSPEDIELLSELFADLRGFLNEVVSFNEWAKSSIESRRDVVEQGLNLISENHSDSMKLNKLMVTKWNDVIDYFVDVI